MLGTVRLRIGPYPLTRSEVSGAFADLGVLIPLEAALIAVNGINPTSTLLGVGIAYIAAGWYFRLPMPVQPLKAFSAIAIAQAVTPSVIAAGALLMSLVMFLLAATRGVEYLTRVISQPVVRGVQFALGLVLIRNAVGMVMSKPFLVGGEAQRYLAIGGLDVSAGLLVGIGSLALLLLFLWRPWLPGAAVVAVGGVLVGLLVGDGDASLSLGPAPLAVAWPPLADFSTALVMLVIPQIPLTLTNSVVATVDTARTYFGPGAARVTPVRTSLSIAVGNLWAGLVGGLPMCHGSGGLTAHYRTGARTPVSTTLIGLLLIAVALLFGVSALDARGLMPYAVLGALLMYVGAQHLLLGLKVNSRPHLAIVGLVGLVVLMPFGNMAVGAGAGLVAYWLARWAARLRAAPAR
jgi:SulP family sulfate permease